MKPTRDLTDEGREAIRPTAERLAKGGVTPATVERGGKAKPWQAYDRQIDGYLASKDIDGRQWRAGDQFWRVWRIAHGSDCKTSSWQGPVNGGSRDMTEAQTASWGKLNNISHAASPNVYAVLRAVCGQDTSASGWARTAHYHPATGLTYLRDALTWYAKFLGYPE